MVSWEPKKCRGGGPDPAKTQENREDSRKAPSGEKSSPRQHNANGGSFRSLVRGPSGDLRVHLERADGIENRPPQASVLHADRDGPLVSKEGLVSIRVPDHDGCRELLRKVGPLTATSANIHSGPDPVTIDICFRQLRYKVSLFLDAGEMDGLPSSIIDLSEGDIKIVREGPINPGSLEQ